MKPFFLFVTSGTGFLLTLYHYQDNASIYMILGLVSSLIAGLGARLLGLSQVYPFVSVICLGVGYFLWMFGFQGGEYQAMMKFLSHYMASSVIVLGFVIGVNKKLIRE